MSFDFLKDNNKKVHFIGIGGISMSGLAEILLNSGYRVSGSDRSESDLTKHLQAKGAEIYIGHNGDNLKDVDLVVYTAAIPDSNPELVKARECNIQTMDRAEFLGHVMQGHKYNIAISGTHGKTTTTSMFSHISLSANLDPTILVGGNLDVINGNVRVGNSEYFVTEACEYKASFLKFYPYIGVILNIEADHLDFYKDINDIQNTFLKFAKLIPSDGFLIVNADDERCVEVSKQVDCNVITFGINNGDVRAKNIVFNNGRPTFDVYRNEEKLFTLTLNVPGNHNILDALASISSALSLNVPVDSIIEGLSTFNGAHRRFEIKGKVDGITVVDDYAHHPTEIKAALNAAKNFPHKRVFCVFQPHTYSRTISLFDDFANSFSNADTLVLADIYAAREKDTGVVSSTMLGDKIRENGVNCKNLHSFEDIVTFLKGELKDGDLLITIGAGDVYRVGEMFLEAK
ncbi:UDP-N-acetylmuramate--alanine ligase [Clostridium novyi A str. 4570]|uniref:UDP-N-acetylmuramate--L-alanine ligase n=1 Tax=Clostridium novyi A str. 4570 TaxID=1444290 RepID=A0AA88ZQK6_CLONO|nr:UDP-N-acetylmuramate--L-alanine ligase [Clostridium novyi]KGN03098.1 UDP-N-acetylmuramate--alanine ligase [Clostridium novyi A str. 4570]